MKKNKDKEKQIIPKKVARPIKEVVPPLNKLPRDNIAFLPPETINRQVTIENVPFQIFPEWPGDEVANV
jgi:hypothetical protein